MNPKGGKPSGVSREYAKRYIECETNNENSSQLIYIGLTRGTLVIVLSMLSDD